jgi:exodeoxyribonuclease-3
VRVVSWNVNSLSARWPRVSDWVRHHDPDVLLLQETKQDDARFPYAEFAELGYESAHLGFGQWNGVAVISKVGLADVELGLAGDEEARHVAATCGRLRCHSCYVPNGRALDDPHYAYKLRWLESLRDGLARRPTSEPTLVGGDFNVAPADLDVWDPAAFVGQTHASAPERQAIAAILDTGLHDAVRELHPEEVIYTWWDYRQAAYTKGWGLRIDLMLVDAATMSATSEGYVDLEARVGEKPSDHAPVVLTIDEAQLS